MHIEKFFQREVESYTLLPDTPYIGKLIEFFDEDECKILILDYIDGRQFKDCLWKKTGQDLILGAKLGVIKKTKVTFSKEQVLKWALQMAQIVQTLQKNDILFGDLHFRNLMLRRS